MNNLKYTKPLNIFLLLVAIVLLAGCSNKYFEKNLECEKQKDMLQYNSDNYSKDTNTIISKIQKVFYSPKAKKCLYVSVSAIDFNSPNNMTALTQKDYSDGARWKLRTISGELVEDLLINTEDEKMAVFGAEPQHTDSYEEFENLVKKWE